MDDYSSFSDIIILRAGWVTRPNNSIEYEYFTGIDAVYNPSGKVGNIKKKTFLANGVIVIYVLYTWDATNNVVKIECKGDKV